ncbi:uncharacterized protein [Antedon mediterranea]|uniref:uncharacterized protein n=1 Tax=Antedon mediterranea TaxID=105859 RepID=UPI003AF5B913
MGDRECFCENGGTCTSSGLCFCASGFKGSTCQYADEVSENTASKTLEIIIVIGAIIFFMINGLCWLFIWYKRKQQIENEGISLDVLNRWVSVHANRQQSLDQNSRIMADLDIPPNYEDWQNGSPGTPVVLPGYLVSHVQHKDKRSYSLPNTTIFVPGYYQPPTGTSDQTPGFSTPSTPVILPGWCSTPNSSTSSPSTPVIVPGVMAPVKLSTDSRQSSSQSTPDSSGVPNGVLSPLARFWKKTSPNNRSMDAASPNSPVFPVTISPLVTSGVKVDTQQQNYITTPTKSSRLFKKKSSVLKLFIPPHDASCSVVDECETAPASFGKSKGKSRGKKMLKKTKHVDESGIGITLLVDPKKEETKKEETKKKEIKNEDTTNKQETNEDTNCEEKKCEGTNCEDTGL